MSDSDSAPEDVTFEAARAVALSHIKGRLQLLWHKDTIFFKVKRIK